MVKVTVRGRFVKHPASESSDDCIERTASSYQLNGCGTHACRIREIKLDEFDVGVVPAAGT